MITIKLRCVSPDLQHNSCVSMENKLGTNVSSRSEDGWHPGMLDSPELAYCWLMRNEKLHKADTQCNNFM